MKYTGLLFDLDGVIVDTAKYHYIAWKEIAEELGITFTEQDNERLKGVSRIRSFEIILEIGKMDMDKKEQERYCELKNDIYLSYIEKLTVHDILPGVETFLKDAKAKGYQIALGSASKNSLLILDRIKLTPVFDAIVDGTKVSKAKPDPEVFTKGAEELRLRYEDCLVFEDSEAGIEAAHKAGMKAIGIGTKELLPEADILITSFQDITIEHLVEQL